MASLLKFFFCLLKYLTKKAASFKMIIFLNFQETTTVNIAVQGSDSLEICLKSSLDISSWQRIILVLLVKLWNLPKSLLMNYNVEYNRILLLAAVTDVLKYAPLCWLAWTRILDNPHRLFTAHCSSMCSFARNSL